MAQVSTATESFSFVGVNYQAKSVTLKRIKKKTRTKRRWIGGLLCLFLGVFGVHRLYFGTKETVPIFYTLTLGGFLILPLIDLFVILFKKDKESLADDKMIFW